MIKGITSTTQNHVDVEDISRDLVLFKDGSCCLVLEVSAINFGLLSEREQDATIYAYAQLLNSLTFSIQIVVSSRQKDVSDYLKVIDDRLSAITSPQIKDQLLRYRDFVRSVVRQGNVLDKKFYVTIPFSALEMGLGKNSAKPKTEILDRAATALYPKRDHLNRLFARIGLRSRQLTNQELLQLFFESYNRHLLGTKVIYPTQP